ARRARSLDRPTARARLLAAPLAPHRSALDRRSPPAARSSRRVRAHRRRGARATRARARRWARARHVPRVRSGPRRAPDPPRPMGPRGAPARRRRRVPRERTGPGAALLPSRARSPAVTALPPVDSVYFDTEWETMPRPQLEAAQLELLLDLLPYAYEHSALVR